MIKNYVGRYRTSFILNVFPPISKYMITTYIAERKTLKIAVKDGKKDKSGANMLFVSQENATRQSVSHWN